MTAKVLTGLFIALILGLGLGAWWARKSGQVPTVSAEAVGTSTPANPTAGPNLPNTGSQTLSAQAADAKTPASETPRLLEVRAWLQNESRAVGQSEVDEQTRLHDIKRKLETFTRTEWNEVARQILDVDGAANERVLSAFMMGLGGFNDLESVERVLDEKLPDGPTKPHSEEEVRSMRERSLRLMVIDGLIAEAKKDTSKRELLAQAIRRIDDPYLRDLANQRARAEGL